MEQYLSTGAKILNEGNVRPDRTGTGTRSLFGPQMRFDLSKGFPMVTSKFVPLRLIAEELLWFLTGDTNNTTLLKKNVHIWDEWALDDKRPIPVDKRRILLVEELAYYAAMYEPDFVAQAIPVFKSNEELNVWVTEFRSTRPQANFAPIPDTIIGPRDGYLGPVYGAMWRSWPGPIVTKAADMYELTDGQVVAQEITGDGGLVHYQTTIDQIQELVDGLKKKPYSRRHIVSGWNPAFLPDESKSHAENVANDKQALPPCHTLFQFYVRDRSIMELSQEALRQSADPVAQQRETATAIQGLNDVQARAWFKSKGFVTQRLDCQLYQRSADWCLGVPFNIASYALLTMMVAQCVDMLPGEFIHTFGDAHIYGNHVETFKEQLQRPTHALPTLKINPEKKDIFGFTIEDFELVGYQHSGKLAYDVAV